MQLTFPQYTDTLGIGKFSHFDTRQLGRRLYEMLDDFTYHDEVYGPIVVKKGFRTNYASLESLRNVVLFPVYALLADYGDQAATLHDWLYSGNPIIRPDGTARYLTRDEADEVFYRALRDEGIARWRASIFYIGVRVGGKSSFLPKSRVIV